MIDINDAPDKKAITLALLLDEPQDDEYLANIRLAAKRLVNAGLGEMIYQTQYSSGSTIWKMRPDVSGITVYTDGRVWI